MRASAPASLANLGAGFDSLALAVDLRCEVEVESSSEWEIDSDQDGFIRTAAARMSNHPLRIQVRSEVPVGKGLGSSAALLAALELSIRRLREVPDDLGAVFASVAAAEGHPDNAAAAVYGGLVLAQDGNVLPLDFHPSLAVIVAVPEEAQATREARSVLPDMVPFDLAVRTSRRAVRLVHGLATGRVEVLAGVGGDELHEPHRVGLRPVIGRLLAAAGAAGAPFVAISGSGPSVLAIVSQQQRDAVVSALEDTVGDGSVLSPVVATEGLR